jgi:hypothetical protein
MKRIVLLTFRANAQRTGIRNGLSFRVEAKVHPEREGATLNKCKPQKV